MQTPNTATTCHRQIRDVIILPPGHEKAGQRGVVLGFETSSSGSEEVRVARLRATGEVGKTEWMMPVWQVNASLVICSLPE